MSGDDIAVPLLAVLRVNIDDTDMNEDGSLLLHHGEPFTGEVEERDGDGRLVALETYRNGRAEGVSRLWHANGRLRSESDCRWGNAIGVSRDWHDNGQLAAEKVFDDVGALMEVRRWNEHGEPVMIGGRARLADRGQFVPVSGVVRSWHDNEHVAEERYVAASGESLAVLRWNADGTPDLANPVVVDTDDTEWDIDGAVVLDGEPFTGQRVEFDREGRIVGWEGYRQGRLHGRGVRWWPDGTTRTLFEATDFGRVVGDLLSWHPNGVLAKRVAYDERGVPVAHEEWDADGEPAPRHGGRGDGDRR